MIKILHTADVHLDSPLKTLALRDAELREKVRTATRGAFARIVETALAEDVAALLIAGDLFDGAQRSAHTAAWLTAQFDRLRSAGVRVFYVKGNHDAENPLTGELDLPDNVHVFDGRGGKARLAEGVWIHGVSFAGRHAKGSLVPKFPAPVEGAINIGLLHTSLAGAKGHDPYAPCQVAELKAHGYDYWALGHVHRRKVHAREPWIVMPGMPQGRDMGEAGAKSATLITIGEGMTVSEIPTSVLEFREIRLTAPDFADELRDGLREKLRKVAEDLACDLGVVRLVLEGESALYWPVLRDLDVWRRTAAELARETGRLWLEKFECALSAPAGAKKGASATDELARIVAQIRKEAGFAQIRGARLRELLAEIPAARRAGLAPDEAALEELGDMLARKGAERVIARLKKGAA